MNPPMSVNGSDGKPDGAGSPRTFALVRHHDPSGISGTGEVAEGVVWSDGSVSLRWHGEHAATTFWEGGVPALLHVHGHNGATEVVYLPQATRSDRWPTRDGPESFPCRW